MILSRSKETRDTRSMTRKLFSKQWSVEILAGVLCSLGLLLSVVLAGQTSGEGIDIGTSKQFFIKI